MLQLLSHRRLEAVIDLTAETNRNKVDVSTEAAFRVSSEDMRDLNDLRILDSLLEQSITVNLNNNNIH